MDERLANVQHALQTITARDLQETEIPPLRYVVEEILPEGLAMLVAPPKFGKSWMALDLCLSVAAEKPFLSYPTRKADVLYLALEDSSRRLQTRQERLLQGQEAPENLHFAIAAGTVDGGLSAQIEEFVKNHPSTGLIVIDVLARIRSQTVTSKTDAYRLDYGDMTTLKTIADKHHICVLVIHHTRKMRDETDVFNDVSGSTGLTGASDTAFVLVKPKRADTRATLHIIGRDVEAAELVIEMGQDCKWRRIGTTEDVQKQNERETFEAHPLVKLIREMIDGSESGSVKVTAEQLKNGLLGQFSDCEGLNSAKKIGRFLADERNKRLFCSIGIEATERKEQEARYKIFRSVDQ